ncbi:MAG TPA: type IV pilus biogenesis/stability protein PilW [Leucothrix sp.]|nr:type IV pilus biogenesis/stability protein PilW [Leucothrix sp.]
MQHTLTITIKHKKKKLITLLSLGFFTLLLNSGCSLNNGDTKAADYNADLGIRYLQKGRLQLANEKLLKSLEQNPKSAKSNHFFALLQQRLKQNNKAAHHFAKAVQYAPKNPEIRNNYGQFLCDTGRPNEAVNQFLVAIKDPLYSTPEFAYTNAGICLRKVNKNAKAEEYFRTALKKRPSFPSALLQMAILHHDRRNYPKAQAFMMRYEGVGRSSPEALKACININSKVGLTSKAASCRTALLRLFPASKEAEQISSSL